MSFQGWILLSFLGQPVPVLNCSHCDTPPPSLYPIRISPAPLLPLIVLLLKKSLSPSFLWPLFKIVKDHNLVHPLSFSYPGWINLILPPLLTGHILYPSVISVVLLQTYYSFSVFLLHWGVQTGHHNADVDSWVLTRRE